MTANAFLINQTSRNALYLQRLAGGEANKVKNQIDQIGREINGILSTATEADFNSGQVLADVETVTRERFTQITEVVKASSVETAQYYSTFQSQLLNKVSKVTAANADPLDVQRSILQSSIDFKPQGSAKTLNDTINEYGKKKAGQFNQIVADGMLEGRTGVEMTREVSEALNISKRQAESLVRTSTNKAANVGRLESFKANNDILEGVEDVAVFDSRCTPYCRQVDGRVRALDEVKESPAYHFGCRTQLVAVIIDKFADPTISGERNAEGGKVTANTSYSGWLRTQDTEFQNEALGVTRAKLWRDGGLTMDKFVDPTGKTLTLEQLAAVDAQAFEKANIALPGVST